MGSARLLVVLVVSACARQVPSEPPKDLTLDFGQGDSVRLVGGADNFDCDDPAYAGVEKLETFTLNFADGTSKRLCKPAKPPAEETEELKLARQYVATRDAVLNITEIARPGKIDPNNRRMFRLMATDFLKHNCKGANCNPQHADWQRAAAIIEADLQRLFAEAAADPGLRVLAKRVQESFAASLATRLSADELWQLTRFYSERPGAQFLKVQQRLFDALASDLLAMQEAMMAGERPAQAALGPDFEERNELLGLFDEFVRIQWGIADPGPGKDRSGLQAIPLMVGGAVDRRLGKLIAVWNQMPSEDRAVILRWRDSPLAKKERDAIFESAKTVRVVFDPRAEMSRVASRIAKLEQKWRSLMLGSTEPTAR